MVAADGQHLAPAELKALVAHLKREQPSREQLLSKQAVTSTAEIGGSQLQLRRLVELHDAEAQRLMIAWLLAALSCRGRASRALRSLLEPLGAVLALRGMQYNVPIAVSGNEVTRQPVHVDWERKGEVILVGIELGGAALNTLVDPRAAVSDIKGGRTAGQWPAATSVLAFEAAVVHSAPRLRLLNARETLRPHIFGGRVFSVVTSGTHQLETSNGKPPWKERPLDVLVPFNVPAPD